VNISEGFIRRPIATSLLMAAIALFGAVAYRSLPVSDLPNVDFPTLLVTAQLPGASRDHGRVGGHAARKSVLHDRGPRVHDVVNSLGSTQITLEFERTAAWTARRGRGGASAGEPAAAAGHADAADLHQVNPADQPILYLVVTSTTLPGWKLDEWAETRIAQRISQVSGVGQVQVLGAQKYAVHVQLDPHALASRQIGINEVENALRAWNVNVPAGNIIGPHRAFTLQATGQLMDAAEFRDMVVSYRNGAAVRLGHLG
jgi:HAE1 family hydrophobic/amphiphilic exporter-1